MFVSANLKLDRANHHIADLKATFNAFVNSNAHSLVLGYTAKHDRGGFGTILPTEGRRRF
jgi:hypothetical protein